MYVDLEQESLLWRFSDRKIAAVCSYRRGLCQRIPSPLTLRSPCSNTKDRTGCPSVLGRSYQNSYLLHDTKYVFEQK